MPVNWFDPVEWLKILSLVLLFGSPVFVVVGFICYAIRQTDNARMRRGFEVKTNTGEEPVIKERRENDHG
jgi:hypothetical protein